MCVLFLANGVHPRYELLLVLNRDEFYSRPTQAADFWPGNEKVLAGRDLKSGGSWFGVTTDGRMALVTNYRKPHAGVSPFRSRGELVEEYLTGAHEPLSFLKAVELRVGDYKPFNLILGSGEDLFYYSSITREHEQLDNGWHGMSNGLLNTPWPKVTRGLEEVRRIFTLNDEVEFDDLLAVMEDPSQAPDEELPDTGVGIEYERVLSPLFIKTAKYGTRSTTFFRRGRDGTASFFEKTHAGGGGGSVRRYDFSTGGKRP